MSIAVNCLLQKELKESVIDTKLFNKNFGNRADLTKRKSTNLLSRFVDFLGTAQHYRCHRFFVVYWECFAKKKC